MQYHHDMHASGIFLSDTGIRGVQTIQLVGLLMLSKFWSDFLTGPPMAGLFADMGALIAYAAARRTAGISRSNALCQEWWDQAEWAIEMARSNDKTERIVGLRALAH